MVMCLFPRFIKNKRYLPNKKNGGIPPQCDDYRKLYVPVGCGVCLECMKQKAMQWKIRLNEEIKVNKRALYVTLSFAPDELKKLLADLKTTNECNAVAGLAIRRFLERYRKKTKKSIRHFLITELGQDNTERIHLHGILFSDTLTKEELESFWQYGNVKIGDYCNGKTINYIAKYITKIDKKHKNYQPQIFCSAGLGKNYIEREQVKTIHRYKDNNTIEFYRFPNGRKGNLPIYYRNKLYTEEQRENLWINKIEQNKRYVMGIEINNVNTSAGEKLYFDVLKKAREKNLEFGYGDLSKEWKKKDYNVTWRMLQKGTNIEN